MAIHYVLNHPGDADRGQKAFDNAWQQSQKCSKYTDKADKSKQGIQVWLAVSQQLNTLTDESGSLLLEDIDQRILNCRERIGWLQRAIVLSFYYLLRHQAYVKQGQERKFYEDAIRQTIREGGDTDTNACIAGGMIGALVGVKNLPYGMYRKVLSFDCTQAA